MNLIESWIDGESVRKLAAHLLEEPHNVELSLSEEAGYANEFVGFVKGRSKEAGSSESAPHSSAAVPPQAPVPKVKIETAHRGRRKVAPALRPLAAKKSEHDAKNAVQEKPKIQSAANDFEAPIKGRLVARLEYFRAWLNENCSGKGAFILDRSGEPILGDPSYARFYFLARSLAQAYRPIKEDPGNVHVKINAESYLVVLPTKTDFGTLILGMIVPEPLDKSKILPITEALTLAAQPIVPQKNV